MLHEIVWLASNVDPTRRFPYAESFAEGDQEVDMRWPLTSLGPPEIVRVEILPAELAQVKWMRPHQPALLQFQSRVNKLLGRVDLRVSWKFISSDHWARTPHATSVLDFPEIPAREYRDIFAPDEQAHEVGRQSVQDFMRDGGLFTEL